VTLLTARGVSRAFGRRVALRPTDLTLVEGEVVALVGPNGAGKSTLLAILAGALAPTAGSVERHAAVGWVPQRSAHYARLTSRENLVLFAALEQADAGRVDQLLGEFELPEDVRAGELSVGNRQRLDVALALLASPRVLLLDEPTASLDPAQRRRLWEIASDVREGGGSVLVATHHWDELSGHADRTLELVDGSLNSGALT
jgi:ABC-2 type transport system ATP-binding protein